uniref:ADP/ATP translocase n=1 Tax=Otus sunia TaxID=257818 RepID=A0A8C8BDD1_9STRI
MLSLVIKSGDVREVKKDVLASNMAAAISKMVVVPVEQVKLLLQVQASSKQIQSDGTHKGMVDCFVHIPREQRFFSFWHGSLANVIQYFPTQALNFSFKDKQIFMSRVGNSSRDLVTPLLKQQTSELPGLYQGFGVTVVAFTNKNNLYMPPFLLYFAGIIAKSKTNFHSFFPFFTTQVPFDTVRRHMMMQVRWKGLNAFFCGTFSNILCGTGRALVLVLYDRIKAIF